MVLRQRKKSETGLKILPKIIHIYPKKRRKMEAIVQCTCPLIKKISSSIHSSLSILWETLLEKIYWEADRIPWRNEMHSDLLLNSHGRLFIFCTNQSGLLNSLRAYFIGKFAILEFTPASSPFLSSHRQARHLCVHIGKIRQVWVHIGKHRQVWVHIGKIRQVWVNIGKIRQVWANIGKIRQVLSSYRQVCQSLLIVNEPIF